ncbi:hypothetical protein [Cellulomonas aerilata]|uniref:Uncharacterized protein n=1 Tax=Cellulomonas aerilata TaxID=515326 RepID=A0A512DFT1_9CELL|nr:hypothetical protein [Cellulomonas aerilata]GEO35302.1 hypothetical protein CAE01nite_30270 [Cellulomonas aerilata]
MTGAGGPPVRIRAGFVAEYRGREYACVPIPPADPRSGEGPGPDAGKLHLRASGAEPCPEGFEEDRWLEWSAFVRRDEVTRLVFVHTTAVWTGPAAVSAVASRPGAGRGGRVVVRAVQDGGEAVIDRGPWPPGDVVAAHEGDRSAWEMWVPVSSLVDVVEETIEVPL